MNGNDTLRGNAGGDTLNGEAGTDTATYSESAGGVTVDLLAGTGLGGNAQGDTLIGIENVNGSQGNDTLTGDAAANVLRGMNGNDILRGSAGADTMNGEGGNDTASYFNSIAAVTVNLTAGNRLRRLFQPRHPAGHRERLWQPVQRHVDRRCGRQCAAGL